MNDPSYISLLHLAGGYNFARPFEDDLIYSDDDDDDDDDDYNQSFSHKSLEPHPQIKQLTEEVPHLSFFSYGMFLF